MELGTHTEATAHIKREFSTSHMWWNKRLVDWQTNERSRDNGCIMTRKSLGYEVKRCSVTSRQSLMVIRVDRCRCGKAKAEETPLFGPGCLWEWMALLVWPYVGESAAGAGAKPTYNGSSMSATRHLPQQTNKQQHSRQMCADYLL